MLAAAATHTSILPRLVSRVGLDLGGGPPYRVPARYSRGPPYPPGPPFVRGLARYSPMPARYSRGSPYSRGLPYSGGPLYSRGATYSRGAPCSRAARYSRGAPYSRSTGPAEGARNSRSTRPSRGARFPRRPRGGMAPPEREVPGCLPLISDLAMPWVSVAKSIVAPLGQRRAQYPSAVTPCLCLTADFWRFYAYMPRSSPTEGNGPHGSQPPGGSAAGSRDLAGCE